jgi:hypothetical protein
MDILQSVPRALFLKGVFKKKSYENTNEFSKLIASEAKKFDKIPPFFTSIEEWPTRTNLSCWSCTLRIVGRPLPIPKAIDPNYSPDNAKIKGKNILVTVDGISCSYCCGLEYIRNQTPGDYADKQNIENMFRYVYYLLTGTHVVHSHIGPGKKQLLQYGGEKTDDELRKKILEIEKTINNNIDTVGNTASITVPNNTNYNITIQSF